MSYADKMAFRINEVVATTGLSRSTIYNLISQGRLRAVKAAGRRLILREDLDRYFEGLKV
ncbi:helix-turn-helix domain-containing protein [Phenylobacterium sp. 20VBR1]|uniref:Helix-turn-helix domain-containing protein n=1 Tax=Phenylobacterium glaciei TaxID=2803784 RepID=A0A941D118_9CAUL|nr:helix-turn-helix domain-containing protein [Phenylobacterium glaciei]MBR7619962.1 helix-turn-helix domain-containing protein [Phenylobacterium glaciei]QQZ48876.1 helix-turn-helix domain-containing protein [Phenylobacterium glaciei]